MEEREGYFRNPVANPMGRYGILEHWTRVRIVVPSPQPPSYSSSIQYYNHDQTISLLEELELDQVAELHGLKILVKGVFSGGEPLDFSMSIWPQVYVQDP